MSPRACAATTSTIISGQAKPVIVLVLEHPATRGVLQGADGANAVPSGDWE